MRNAHLVIAAAAALALSCSKANDVACQPGYATCGAACVRIATDTSNCGACGHACGPTQACVAGACVADCRASLHAPIDDPWGASWDGLERPTATYLAARATCEGIGGRLPTATEIVRAGPKTAAVGDSYQTSYLWSLAPLDATNGLSVRMSDGAYTAYAMATAQVHYRCVCPPPRPAAFTGSACYTTGLGDGCVPFPGDASLNVDAEERTALTRSAATYECALAGGELPDSERLVAALAGGLPNLTGALLHAGDAISSVGLSLVVSSAAAPTYGASADASDYRAFRCIGPASAGAAATIAGGFREPRGERAVDGDDRAATTYTTALLDCLSRGGHLPTGNELMAFAIQGLPAGGVTGPRWSADQSSATVETFSWPGAAYWPVDPDLAPTVTANGVTIDGYAATRTAKSASLPYRCIYYGTRAGYAAPSAAACGTDGCLRVPVGARASMWFQARPHGGSSGDTYLSAILACASMGGRLPSARDLVEAIHAGLDNRTNSVVVTSDVAETTLVRTLQWNAPYPTDAEPNATTIGITGGGKSYYCMWTDEIR